MFFERKVVRDIQISFGKRRILTKACIVNLKNNSFEEIRKQRERERERLIGIYVDKEEEAKIRIAIITVERSRYLFIS